MSNSDKIIIRCWLDSCIQGCDIEEEIEVDRAEWESMSADERDQTAREAVFDRISWGWEVKGETDAES